MLRSLVVNLALLALVEVSRCSEAGSGDAGFIECFENASYLNCSSLCGYLPSGCGHNDESCNCSSSCDFTCPPIGQTWYSRSVIGGLSLVFTVMVIIVGVLVMAAKEEDGHMMTTLIQKEAARLTAASREQMNELDEDTTPARSTAGAMTSTDALVPGAMATQGASVRPSARGEGGVETKRL